MKKVYLLAFTLINILVFSQEKEKSKEDSIRVQKEIEQINIISKKKVIEQKVDRLVFNVENSVAASNGTALDALRVTPGISIQNDNISIVGKNSIRVLINGRIIQFSGEELVSYLGNLASDDIKNIEVITTPPAKYEAEGNSGLINIVLKKQKANSWSNQVRTSYQQATYPTVNLGNIFKYNHKKLKIAASIDGRKGNRQSLQSFQINYPSGPWKDTIYLKDKRGFISGRLDLDYQLSEKSSIGLIYSGSYIKPDSKTHSLTHIFDLQNSIAGYIKNQGTLDANKNYNTLNLHYLQKLDTLGRNLSLDVDYFSYNNRMNRVFSSERTGNITGFHRANNISSQNIQNYSAKIDIEHPFNWAELSYGAKITRTQTDNKISYYDLTYGNAVLDDNGRSKMNILEAPAYAVLNLGLKMQLLNKKLQITARVNDVFRSSNPDITTYTNGVKQVYNVDADNRSFTLGINYKFGNNKIRVTERETGNQEEFDRRN